MKTRLVVGLVMLGLIVAALAVVLLEPTGSVLGLLRGEPFFHDRPASYWGRALRDREPAARTNAMKELADGGAEAVPVLVALLPEGRAGNEDASARTAAVEALGEIGPAARDAVPALKKALYDADDGVRREAADALKRIEAKPGDDR